MDKDFEKQIKYVGIPAWHAKGIKGKESTVFCDDVGGNHADYVKMIIETILPEATVLTGNIEYQINNGNVIQIKINCRETGESLPFDEFIQKYSVKLLNNSTDGGNHDKNSAHAKFMREKILHHNLIMTGSAGNKYGSPIDNKYYGAAIMVTGCNLVDEKPKKSTYAEDPDIDFCMFTAGNSGTSFAAPFLLGLIGLLVCKNPNLTQEQAYQYLKNHCQNLGNKEVFGWGLPILGEPVTEVKLQIGSNKMTVDGIEQIIDQPPVIDKKTKRTLAPVRSPLEAFGIKVSWDEKTQTITLEG